MPQKPPALSLVAVPGRRIMTLELAREIEARGFSGIYCPSIAGGLALCEGIAQVTETIRFGTAVSPIYTRPALDFAQNASFIHEVSGGRFRFGVGVSHAPSMSRMGLEVGKPVTEMRAFADAYNKVTGVGEKPPLVLATLRKRMIALAAEVGDGMVFANGARSHMKESLAAVPKGRLDDRKFFVGNMIPICISDDLSAARAVHRRNLTHYAKLPNYRNYWREAGYEEEMAEIDAAIIAGNEAHIPQLLTDKWLDDTTLSGPPARVREGLDEWYDAGIKTPILVPSSAAGNQMKAFQEVFATFGN